MSPVSCLLVALILAGSQEAPKLQKPPKPLAITQLRKVNVEKKSLVNPGVTLELGTTQDATITATLKTVAGKTLTTFATKQTVTRGKSFRLVCPTDKLMPGSYVIEVVAENDKGDRVIRALPIVLVS